MVYRLEGRSAASPGYLLWEGTFVCLLIAGLFRELPCFSCSLALLPWEPLPSCTLVLPTLSSTSRTASRSPRCTASFWVLLACSSSSPVSLACVLPSTITLLKPYTYLAAVIVFLNLSQCGIVFTTGRGRSGVHESHLRRNCVYRHHCCFSRAERGQGCIARAFGYKAT